MVTFPSNLIGYKTWLHSITGFSGQIRPRQPGKDRMAESWDREVQILIKVPMKSLQLFTHREEDDVGEDWTESQETQSTAASIRQPWYGWGKPIQSIHGTEPR